ncbi:hypothetical protein OH77DRAFT_151406 [Trametes cingulata]|nr:hypothetical protein OH77DRAFT_151406 [Trametes cingulata]
MQGCPLPIELCETIMEDVSNTSWSHYPRMHSRRGDIRQRTLCACALTCRAWRYPAQRLLRMLPRLARPQSIAQFVASVRGDPDGWKPLVRALRIDGGLKAKQYMSMALGSDILMPPFPCLQSLDVSAVKFDLRPTLLHMRRSFFASIRNLFLERCWFDTVPAMFDIIWSCPELVHLEILYCEVRNEDLPLAKDAQLFSIRSRRGACEKLTRLRIEGRPIGNSTTYLSGGVFSPAVTQLQVRFTDITTAKNLAHFLHDSFPALRAFKVLVSELDTRSGYTPPALLHMLTEHAYVETIVIHAEHDFTGSSYAGDGPVCCQRLVGKPGERDGRSLRALLPRLRKLSFRLSDEYSPELCAAYIESVVEPDLRGILEFFVYRQGVSLPFDHKRATGLAQT